MSMIADKLLADALQLPQDERRRVAEELWNSLPDATQREIEERAFWDEIKQRNSELDEGLVKPLSHDEIMSSARETLRGLSATIPESAKN